MSTGRRRGRWQFWIDVGGTFTDCLSRAPDGTLRLWKVLSSGVVKGRVEAILPAGRLRVSGLRGYSSDFFCGYRLHVLGPSGERQWEAPVATFAATDVLEVSSRGGKGGAAMPEVGAHFELDAGEPAPILVIRRSLGLGLTDPLGAVDVRLGTTRGTNALLERTGARTALVTTQGFADILRIGSQNRPRLFALDIRKPEPLHESVVEVDERIAADGAVVRPIDCRKVASQLAELLASGIESIAICLLNAYQNPAHELVVAEEAAAQHCSQISVSTQVSPTQKIVARGDTTLVDAYLTPVIRDYIATIRAAMPEGRLRLMTSAGGLVDAEAYSGRDTVLSGPAAGVVALAEVTRRAGLENAIGFDMGGTSTDVSRYSGEFSYEFETEKAGVRIVAPMLAIETVAAGGGSICDFDGQKLSVGPSSAGAEPGPACYGRGGPLALTDVNVYLGRILPSFFPFALDVGVVERRLEELSRRVARESGRELDAKDLAVGFIRIADANMAAAIQKISVAKGYDVREYTLVSFGGAGGQHACSIAADLGQRQILIHPYASVLCAFGMGVADVKRFGVRTVLQIYSPGTEDELGALFREVERELEGEILSEGISRERISVPKRVLELRYRGQSSTIGVPCGGDLQASDEFERLHRRLYGHVFPGREIEVVTLRVEVSGSMDKAELESRPEVENQLSPGAVARVCFSGEWRQAAIYERTLLRPGDGFSGPAIVVEDTATTVVEPGWRCRLLARGELLLERSSEFTAAEDATTEVTPVELELFNNRFAAIAEQMGAILQRTSLSVNVKERLDYSCAIFTGAGDLVANAPHMPVHLGAMSETVRCLLEDVPRLAPGDVLLTNDPFRGGSHLPDLTVVTPVFAAEGESPIFFTASRAHHADIGGICPGSMPPNSRNLEEEGVLVRAFKVVEEGRPRFDKLRELLAEARYPARMPNENLADVGAQIAANQAGALSLRRLMERHGRQMTLAYMGHIQDAAERKMRSSLGRLADGVYRFSDRLDEGSSIHLALEVSGEEAVLDFSGTSAPLRSNLNANLAIVKAAVIYSFRCLIDEEIPLNEGVLLPLDVRVPVSLLNPPSQPEPAQCPAVVGGNVETSQRVTDVILGALALAAASQGTMNNLTFGNADFGYYETICGGAGAGPGFAGADAVHTHMTNTRLTDAEVLEAQYPVRLRRFEIRRGSGGGGRFTGGDGVRREMEFLEPLDVAILSQRRTTRPFGLAGGKPGKAGRNTLLRRDGRVEDLGPVAAVKVEPGDRLLIETPGGGGYGQPE